MDKTSKEYIEFLELVMPNLRTVSEEDYDYQISLLPLTVPMQRNEEELIHEYCIANEYKYINAFVAPEPIDHKTVINETSLTDKWGLVKFAQHDIYIHAEHKNWGDVYFVFTTWLYDKPF